MGVPRETLKGAYESSTLHLACAFNLQDNCEIELFINENGKEESKTSIIAVYSFNMNLLADPSGEHWSSITGGWRKSGRCNISSYLSGDSKAETETKRDTRR